MSASYGAGIFYVGKTSGYDSDAFRFQQRAERIFRQALRRSRPAMHIGGHTRGMSFLSEPRPEGLRAQQSAFCCYAVVYPLVKLHTCPDVPVCLAREKYKCSFIRADSCRYIFHSCRQLFAQMPSELHNGYTASLDAQR